MYSSLVPSFVSIYPSGTSTSQFTHFFQIYSIIFSFSDCWRIYKHNSIIRFHLSACSEGQMKKYYYSKYTMDISTYKNRLFFNNNQIHDSFESLVIEDLILENTTAVTWHFLLQTSNFQFIFSVLNWKLNNNIRIFLSCLFYFHVNDQFF